MPKYIVKYYFDGQGAVKVEAKSKKEAEEKFMDGDYNEQYEEEWGNNYVVDEVEKA